MGQNKVKDSKDQVQSTSKGNDNIAVLSAELAEKALKMSTDEGIDLKEALERVLKTRPSVVRPQIENRVEWISSLDNLEELRRAIKIAHAKKSKAKTAGNDVAIARYENEIKAGQDRYNELVAAINTSADPLKAAIENGESVSGVIQMVLQKYEEFLKPELENLADELNLMKKTLKLRIRKASKETPKSILKELEALGPEYLKNYTTRLNNGDQRISTINRRYNLRQDLMVELAETQEKAAKAASRKKEKVAGAK
ncbi:MAG: hypothetical protein ACOX6L_12160 [Syntrophomonadaceae bacterium]|jgi:hypothetical protein